MGSLVAVAALVGVAFLFGGVGQLVVAGRVETWRWLFIVTGILAVAAGIMTLAAVGGAGGRRAAVNGLAAGGHAPTTQEAP